MTDKNLFDLGMENRKKVLGEAHVNNAWKNASDFNKSMQKLTTEYCWGEAWGDPTISFRDRSMINIAILTVMGQEHELTLHVKGALRNGLSEEEIKSILLHVTTYAGIPAGMFAFRVASQAIEEYQKTGG